MQNRSVSIGFGQNVKKLLNATKTLESLWYCIAKSAPFSVFASMIKDKRITIFNWPINPDLSVPLKIYGKPFR